MIITRPTAASVRQAAPTPVPGDGADSLPLDGGNPLSHDRRWACIAAFYAGESAMRESARDLRQHHGLDASQLVMMGPRDAEPGRFARHRLRWTGRWSGGHPDEPGFWRWRAGAAGALVLGIAAAGWALQSDLPFAGLLVGLMAAALVAVVLGRHLVVPWSDPPRARRFETTVRRQLSQGAWALVVHRMPRDRQAGVVALLRRASLRWCAVAGPSMRL